MTCRGVLVLALLIAASGCGGKDSPAAPTGGSGGGSGSGSRGTITAVIDGVSFNGSALTAATNTGGIFSTAATSGNTTVGFAALAAVGTTSIGPLSPTNSLLQVAAGGTSSRWVANVTGGTGTLTVATLTSTSASGTFSFTMNPVAGTPATGIKTVTNGTFNVS